MKRFLSAVFVVISISIQCFSQVFNKPGAGVTIIVHGWNLDATPPSWMQNMADAIITRSGGNGCTCTITVTGTSGNLKATCSNWNFDLGNATSGEIVVLVNWAAVANHIFSGVTAQSVAAVIAPKIYQSQNSQPALAELPVHLIGHSRGGGMIFEIARLLGLQGIEVEQVTALDPHPLTSDDLQGLSYPLGPGQTIDTPVQIYENILFVDNYWQNINYPKGQYLTGAYNRLWTALPGGYHNESGYNYTILGTNYDFSNHLNILLAYHGTIDCSTPVSNGQATMGTDERAWFNSYENNGENTGFKYSRIVLGNRKSSDSPVSSGDEITDGYNNDILLGGKGARQSLTWTDATWCNVIASTVKNLSAELSPGSYFINNGDVLSVNYKFRSYLNACNATFYLDTDRNPYNNNNVATIGSGNLSATGSTISQTTFDWSVSGLTAGTKYYVCCKITDGTHTRFKYLDYEFAEYKLPDQAGVISGSATVCQGQDSEIYTVPAIANATSYTWTLPPGATGTSTTNTITVEYGSSAASGDLTVKGTNECGDGAVSTLTITVKDKPATPVITLNGSVLHSGTSTGNQWYNQNGIIKGATGQDYTVNTGGGYYDIVTSSGCSSDPSEVINVVITGVGAIVADRIFDIYPNPVSDELIIKVNGDQQKISFELLNIGGQVVLKGNFFGETVIQTTDLLPGIYLLKLGSGQSSESWKIIKR